MFFSKIKFHFSMYEMRKNIWKYVYEDGKKKKDNMPWNPTLLFFLLFGLLPEFFYFTDFMWTSTRQDGENIKLILLLVFLFYFFKTSCFLFLYFLLSSTVSLSVLSVSVFVIWCLRFLLSKLPEGYVILFYSYRVRSTYQIFAILIFENKLCVNSLL